MDQETADEFFTWEAHRLLAVVIPVILPAKTHLAVIYGHQPIVGNRDAVGVAPDIVENLGRACERPLRVDDPLGVVGRRQMAPGPRGLMQMSRGGAEGQNALSR